MIIDNKEDEPNEDNNNEAINAELMYYLHMESSLCSLDDHLIPQGLMGGNYGNTLHRE